MVCIAVAYGKGAQNIVEIIEVVAGKVFVRVIKERREKQINYNML
jgi:hypothetical protein